MQRKEYTVATQQGDMAVIEMGNPHGVPVIALHGWLDNAASFIPLAVQLKDVRLYALDLAGHGHSYHRAFPYNYNIWDDLIDILAVADHLKLERFGLLGHSRGAGIANMLAATSKRVNRLGLLDGYVNSFAGTEKAAINIADYLIKRQRGRLRPLRYKSFTDMVNTRVEANIPLTQASAELIVGRNTTEIEGEYIWRTDQALRWRSAVHFTPEQTASFVKATTCATTLWLADSGITSLASNLKPVENHPHYSIVNKAGSHHFHMETELESLGEEIDQLFAS